MWCRAQVAIVPSFSVVTTRQMKIIATRAHFPFGKHELNNLNPMLNDFEEYYTYDREQARTAAGCGDRGGRWGEAVDLAPRLREVKNDTHTKRGQWELGTSKQSYMSCKWLVICWDAGQSKQLAKKPAGGINRKFPFHLQRRISIENIYSEMFLFWVASFASFIRYTQ